MAQGAAPSMQRFWREIAAVTAAKALALAALYLLFFAAPPPPVDSGDHLFTAETRQ